MTLALPGEAWDRFPAVWVLDTEFSQAAGAGPVPVAVCGLELRSGRRVALWVPDLVGSRPFFDSERDLLVTYFGLAECSVFRELDWPLPRWHYDAFTEWRNATNGTAARSSLLFAAEALGVPAAVTADEKDAKRRAIGEGRLTAADREWVLTYCAGDVDTTAGVFLALVERTRPDAAEVERALVRGRFMTACALVEAAGIPVDHETTRAIRAHWGNLRRHLLRTLDVHQLLDLGTFKRDRFMGFLREHGLLPAWPRTDLGEVRLDDDAFKLMARAVPAVAQVRELRTLAGQLREWDLPVGSDGRARCPVRPFATRTGRCAPSTSQFLYGLPKWCRNLMRPAPGTGLRYVDLKSAEFGVAAALSGDETMWAAYEDGDPYLFLGKHTGLLPPEATKASHKAERDRLKVVSLGVQYGQRPKGIAASLGVTEAEAGHLLHAHQRAFPAFWRWQQDVSDAAQLTRGLATPYGWRLRDAAKAKATAVANWPIQATAAEVFRFATVLALEAGVQVCALVHDALLVEAPEGEVEDAVRATRDAFAQASRLVLGGRELHTDHEDPCAARGGAVWDEVLATLTEFGPAPVDTDLPF